jgi:hypothetical protein
MLALSGDAIIAGGAVIGAALITGPLLFVMSRFDRRNTEQHLVNAAQLQMVIDKLDSVHDDTSDNRRQIHAHIAWHAHVPETQKQA